MRFPAHYEKGGAIRTDRYQAVWSELADQESIKCVAHSL